MNIKDCQVFTPVETVKKMLDLLNYRNDVFDKLIIDNSCGNGNFLVEVVHRLIADGKRQMKSKRKIRNALERCVFGCDIDLACIQECINRLNKATSEYGYKNIKWNIVQCDGLYYDNENNFDFVVGNPPYISYLDLDREIRSKTKENFSSCSKGKFDYSYAFIEKGLKLLNPAGKMAMITPANMFKTVFAENLRKLIKSELTYIIDCSSEKIFEGVLTSPAITIYEKGCKSNILTYKEMLCSQEKHERIISKDSLAGKWNFTAYITEGKTRFGDHFRASNSIATLANKIFIHSENKDGKLDIDIENDITRITKSPKSEQFQIRQRIIFPYYYKDEVLNKYSEEEMMLKFPKAMSYLSTEKEKLLKRNLDKNAKWYEFGRSQALQHINKPKLLLSTIITKSVKLYFLDENTVPYSGIYIIPTDDTSLDEACTILRTQRFYDYLLTKGVKVSGDSIRISSKDVEEYKY